MLIERDPNTWRRDRERLRDMKVHRDEGIGAILWPLVIVCAVLLVTFITRLIAYVWP